MWRRQPCLTGRDADACHRLAEIVHHFQERPILLGVGLLEKPPRTDDGRQPLLKRTGREVSGETRRLLQTDFQVASASARLPRDRCAPITASRQTRAGPTDAIVKCVKDGEPVPRNGVMPGWQERLQAPGNGIS